ncbi:hypothetical protein IMG5_098320 [Ichthyophthirius multifiliis]|uniref:Transmembrane protein n=1 Tax=Ichthyophthirius multifiliis TaxID=5932 RepID=G0QRX6_ICHMU|nr:hypothetical protein IMG5_098320 [Ichthyophthirius multifiliis]EGR32006.1 hypothetical protein IMG5_098320 [Ichthyophthirius multifiliis]|eukprot:XP_004035492.1 hypothetical protein IMG5_098320 [Ichthyophthirius multifiliis]
MIQQQTEENFKIIDLKNKEVLKRNNFLFKNSKTIFLKKSKQISLLKILNLIINSSNYSFKNLNSLLFCKKTKLHFVIILKNLIINNTLYRQKIILCLFFAILQLKVVKYNYLQVLSLNLIQIIISFLFKIRNKQQKLRIFLKKKTLFL